MSVVNAGSVKSYWLTNLVECPNENTYAIKAFTIKKFKFFFILQKLFAIQYSIQV